MGESSSTDAVTLRAWQQLMARIGLSPDASGGSVNFTGADPVIGSRVRYGAATASALAAQAAGAAVEVVNLDHEAAPALALG